MFARILVLSALLLCTNLAWGRSVIDFSIHQQFISPRAQGMGNTFSGMDDYNAIFYNPAFLALQEEGEINAGIQIAGSDNFLSLSEDIEGAGDSTQDMANVLSKNQGENFHVRGPTLNLIWSRPRWAIAIVPLDLSLNLGIQQAFAPSLAVKAINDTTVAFGKGWSLNDQKSFNIGVTGKVIYRASIDRSFNAFELADDSDFFQPDEVKEGLMIDADLGLSYKADVPKRGFFKFLKYAAPTFSIVGRNLINEVGHIGNLHLYSPDSDENEKPTTLQTRLDIGSRWDLPTFWVFTPRFLFDVRDIGHRYWTFTKGLHTGAEFQWKVSDWFQGGWRAGLSQGYWTAGVTGHALWFRLDLVSYADEIGTTDAPQENRIYMLKTSINF